MTSITAGRRDFDFSNGDSDSLPVNILNNNISNQDLRQVGQELRPDLAHGRQAGIRGRPLLLPPEDQSGDRPDWNLRRHPAAADHQLDDQQPGRHRELRRLRSGQLSRDRQALADRRGAA
ncbi:hypothetical protein ACRAWD_30295 [Caulobacter segnis]